MYESERLSKGIEVGSLSQQYSSTQLMQMTSNWVRTGTEQVALKKQMGQHVRRKRQRLSRFIVSYDSANKQKHHKSHRMQ